MVPPDLILAQAAVKTAVVHIEEVAVPCQARAAVLHDLHEFRG
jgi:hypothetical protein